MSLYLVTVEPGKAPNVKEFEALHGLLPELKALNGQDVYAFVFDGNHWPISVGPDRFLCPGGNTSPIPLFATPDASSITCDPSGYMGEQFTEAKTEIETDEPDSMVEMEEDDVEEIVREMEEEDDEFDEFEVEDEPLEDDSD